MLRGYNGVHNGIESLVITDEAMDQRDGHICLSMGDSLTVCDVSAFRKGPHDVSEHELRQLGYPVSGSSQARQQHKRSTSQKRCFLRRHSTSALYKMWIPAEGPGVEIYIAKPIRRHAAMPPRLDPRVALLRFHACGLQTRVFTAAKGAGSHRQPDWGDAHWTTGRHKRKRRKVRMVAVVRLIFL